MNIDLLESVEREQALKSILSKNSQAVAVYEIEILFKSGAKVEMWVSHFSITSTGFNYKCVTDIGLMTYVDAHDISYVRQIGMEVILPHQIAKYDNVFHSIAPC